MTAGSVRVDRERGSECVCACACVCVCVCVFDRVVRGMVRKRVVGSRVLSSGQGIGESHTTRAQWVCSESENSAI